MYFCDVCDYCSIDILEIHNHLIQSHFNLQNRVFTCRICSLKFFNLTSFKNHIRIHEISVAVDNNVIYCKTCNLSVNNHKIKTHLLEHLSNGSEVFCPICDTSSKSLSGFRSHIYRRHDNFQEFESKKRNFNSLADEILIDSSINESLNESLNHEELNFSVECEENPPESFNFSDEFGLMLLNLKSKYSIPEQVLSFIVTSTKTLISSTFQSVEKVVDGKNFTEISTQIGQLKKKLTNFSEFESPYKRNKYFKTHFKYVEPVKIALPTSSSSKDEKFYYYVPIAESLMSLVEDPDVAKLLFTNKKSPAGVLKDYVDGEMYLTSNSLNLEQKELEIIIFEDGMSLNNPLGPSKHKDKMIYVYYALGNLPINIRTRSDNIQLIFSFPEDFLSDDQTYCSLFEHMVNELNYLSSMGITPIGMDRFKVKLMYVVGDNLGQHLLGGFNASFSRSFFLCRFCYWSREDKENGDLTVKAKRTDENFDSNDHKFSFVKHPSPLSKINGFSLAKGLPPCVAHNLFSTGCFSRDLLPILEIILKQGNISFDHLDGDLKKLAKTIKNISFPSLARSNINGNMHDIYLLIVYLPVILINYNIDRFSNSYKLLTKMIEITKIVMAYKISMEQVDELRTHIEDYFILRKLIFGIEKLMPKHHYLLHLPELIVLLGPPLHYSSLPFEHKHQFFKYVSQHAHNSVNIEKTTTERHQLRQSALHKDRIKNELVCNSTQILDHTILNIQIPENFMFKAKRILFKNIDLKTGDYMLIKSTKDFIELLNVKYFILDNSYIDCLMSGTRSKFIYDKEKLLYQQILTIENDEIISLNDILFHKPIHVFQSTISFSILTISVPQ